MKWLYVSLLTVTAALPVFAQTPIAEPVNIEGYWTALELDPEDGGAVHTFKLTTIPGNQAGEDGLLQEGFGVGSYYVPNRRLNPQFQILDTVADRPVLQFEYGCDGPNIKGLKSVRRMEPLPNEAAMRVTWTVTNEGDERQWVAPWLENDVAPGGNLNAYDRIDLPTLDGIIQPDRTAYHPMARNWVALTDAVEQVSFFTVFYADHLHSVLAYADDPGRAVGNDLPCRRRTRTQERRIRQR